MAEKIMIDAGHNGLTDPGAVYNGRRESDDVLRLAQAVGAILSRNGYDVVYTRTGDINQSVLQKTQLANEADADLLVSIHRNMATYPGQYDGVQTLLYDLSGDKLIMAQNINQNLAALGFRNINVEARPDLTILKRTGMPAVLVEAGFMDSDKDNQLFDTRFDEIAQAIADGIMDTLTAAAEADTDDPVRYEYRTASLEPASMSATQSGQQDIQENFRPSRPDEMQSQEAMMQPGSVNRLRPRYRVQVGAFHNLTNAIELEQELKRLGYNTWIVTE